MLVKDQVKLQLSLLTCKSRHWRRCLWLPVRAGSDVAFSGYLKEQVLAQLSLATCKSRYWRSCFWLPVRAGIGAVISGYL
jgi:hypothetical protein